MAERNPFNTNFSSRAEEAVFDRLLHQLDGIRDGDVFSALNLEPGDLIEVLWVINRNGEEQEIWWECALLQNTGPVKEISFDDPSLSTDSVNCPIIAVEYTALLPEFPDKERCEICFLSEEQIFDINTQSLMYWRQKTASLSLIELLRQSDISKIVKFLNKRPFLDSTSENQKQQLGTLFDNFLVAVTESSSKLKELSQYSNSSYSAVQQELSLMRSSFIREVSKKITTTSTATEIQNILMDFIATR